MCGLFGILQHRPSGPPARALLEATARRLQHRGPDASGIHSDPNIGLVHTRLSLVDLEARSHQPFWDPSGRYALIYNGELYDWGDLKRRLAKLGVSFRTTSDTEALLLGLMHFGPDELLPTLEGMFTFAWYDSRDQELLLARDRFGIKPLYIHEGSDRFLFGSTIGAFAPWMKLQPNQSVVRSYLLGSNGPMRGPSFCEGIEIVPPGSVLRIRAGGTLARGLFHRPQDLIDPELAEELARCTEPELTERFEQLLQASVDAQLIADAPVGAFCSGGVDSSLLMAMAARSHRNLKVFHADVVGPLSERSAAEKLSRSLGMEMHAVKVTDRDFQEAIPEVTRHFEMPLFVHPTSIPLLLVSRLVQQHQVKAVLSGEGSDECYLGYSWLSPDPLGKIRQVLGRRTKPSPLALASGDGRVVARLAGNSEASLLASWSSEGGAAAPGEVPGLATTPELFYILRSLLHRNDTMGMAASIEARFPFLNNHLVRFAVNLPYRCKVRFSPAALDPAHLFYRDKWIVRRMARRLIPTALSERRKRPFPTNAFQRLRIAPDFLGPSLLSDWWRADPELWSSLWQQASQALRLRLFFLEVWAQICVAETAGEVMQERMRATVAMTPIQ